MSWRVSQADSRERYCRKFDAAEAERYDERVGRITREDEQAYLSDLDAVLPLEAGTRVLDAGAGTGTLSGILVRREGLALTALEPAAAMLAKLRSKPALGSVRAQLGFCDSIDDRGHFGASEFDVVASRQLFNGLFDPLAAFANFLHWLAPGGAVLLIDGLYGRSAWTGVWEEEADALPASAVQTTALAPYLLETAGFRVEHVGLMHAANEQPSTMTTRYVVVARKAP